MSKIGYAQIEAIEMKRMQKLDENMLEEDAQKASEAYAWNDCLNWVISLLDISTETDKIHHQIVRMKNIQHDRTVEYTKNEMGEVKVDVKESNN